MVLRIDEGAHTSATSTKGVSGLTARLRALSLIGGHSDAGSCVMNGFAHAQTNGRGCEGNALSCEHARHASATNLQANENGCIRSAPLSSP